MDKRSVLFLLFVPSIFVLVSAVLTFSRSFSAGGTTFVVTKSTDSDDGTCDTDCSLREAVDAANNSVGVDIIDFQSNIITLTLSLGTSVDIQDDVTINCDGRTINPNDTSRTFFVSGGVVILNDCTILNGYASGTGNLGHGGGIYNAADLIINGGAIQGNTADADGGGIYNNNTGILILNGVSINLNLANDQGGGIFNSGSLTATNIVVEDNTGENDGGGIHVLAGSVNINSSTIKDNTVHNSTGGGGIYNDSSAVAISDSIISGNHGGGMVTIFGGVTTISNSSISDHNVVGVSAGGLVVTVSSALTIRDSTIDGNSSQAGGGITVGSGSVLTVTGSTISNNTGSFGGGIRAVFGSDVNLKNSTLSGNYSSDGGGLYITDNSKLTLTNVTIAFNIASGQGGGIFTGVNGRVKSSNSIIAGNSGGDCYNEAGAVFSTFFANLDGDDSCPDFVTGNAFLGPLQDNGGPTLTHMIGLNSDAIDAGEASVCAAIGNIDQRGFPRPVGPECDLGAVERGALIFFPAVLGD